MVLTGSFNSYNKKHKWVSKGATVFCFFLLWKLIGDLGYFEKYVPTQANVLIDFKNHWSTLINQFLHSLKNASLGFLYGLILAVISNLIVVYFQKLQSFFSFFSVVIYSIPLIAAAPLTALIFGASNTGYILGAIGAFLPIYLTGLKFGSNVTENLSYVSNSFGANKFSELKYIHLPMLIRGWVTGSQSGWLWAVLGALLGDFTGGQQGLGTFLIGSIVQGSISKIWIICILCLTISLIGFITLKYLGSKIIVDKSFDPINMSETNLPNAESELKAVLSIKNLTIFLLMWQFFSWWLNQPGGIFASPIDIFYLLKDIFDNHESFTIQNLVHSVFITLGTSIIGVSISIFLSFSLSVSNLIFRKLTRPLILLMLTTQVTPIVAFIPFIAIIFGRSTTGICLIVILSTIYPTYSIFTESFSKVSLNAINVTKGFGANRFNVFKYVQLPSAVGMIPIACRLAIGRGLLGAITGEYLLSGKGLGGLLGQTRSDLDFRVVWLICLIVAIMTLVFDFVAIFVGKIATKS